MKAERQYLSINHSNILPTDISLGSGCEVLCEGPASYLVGVTTTVDGESCPMDGIFIKCFGAATEVLSAMRTGGANAKRH